MGEIGAKIPPRRFASVGMTGLGVRCVCFGGADMELGLDTRKGCPYGRYEGAVRLYEGTVGVWKVLAGASSRPTLATQLSGTPVKCVRRERRPRRPVSRFDPGTSQKAVGASIARPQAAGTGGSSE